MQRRLARSSRKRTAVPRTEGRALWAILACFLLLTLGSGALAADALPRVVLLDHPDTDELGLELSARVRGELQAAGFEVVVLALPSDVPPGNAAETIARDLDPAAVLVVRKSLEITTGAPIVELWISDRRLDQARGQRLPLSEMEPSASIAKIAVQAADLVRARLAELSVSGAHLEPLPLPLPDPDSAAQPGPPREGTRFSVGLGVGALADFSAGDVALTPLLSASLRLGALSASPAVELRATLGAFGSRVDDADGPLRAEIQQSLGWLEAGLGWRAGPIEPAVFLGGGAYSLEVRGVAPEGYSVSERRSWAAMGAAGAGLAYAPARWFRFRLDARLLAATPGVAVSLAQRDQPERGTWLGLVSFGVAGAF